jgi:hypothetical protein
MGRALYDRSPAAKAVFDAADDALNESFSRIIDFDGEHRRTGGVA